MRPSLLAASLALTGPQTPLECNTRNMPLLPCLPGEVRLHMSHVTSTVTQESVMPHPTTYPDGTPLAPGDALDDNPQGGWSPSSIYVGDRVILSESQRLGGEVEAIGSGPGRLVTIRMDRACPRPVLHVLADYLEPHPVADAVWLLAAGGEGDAS